MALGDQPRIVVFKREDMAQQRQLRPERRDIVEIGIGAIGRGTDERPCVRLLQGVGEIILAVMRVERHEDGPERRAGHLHDGPFAPVLGEKRDVVATRQPLCSQRAGQGQGIVAILPEA